MAIDSRAKRQSILGFPTPGGGINQSDRQTILWIYGGIAAGELVTFKEVLDYVVCIFQTKAPNVTVYQTNAATVRIYETASEDVEISVEE